MKNNQDKINQHNEKILSLVAELHSTLDLYYEPVIKSEIVYNEQ